MKILTAADLEGASLEPGWAEATGETSLVIDARDIMATSDEIDQLLLWLELQPVPVMGICSEPTALSSGFDLVTSSAEDCAALAACIDTAPEVAAILVQTTRATARLPLRQALTAESLAYSTLQGGSYHQQWLGERQPPRLTDAPNPVGLERDEQALHIRLNSPENRNALSVSMRDALSEAFRMAIMDEEIYRVIVTGEGPDFCSGGDLREFGLSKDTALAHHVRQLRMPGQYVGMAPHKFQFHVHGACIGAGIEMPAFAERIVASPGATFRLPEFGFGLIPGAGGCVSIPRRIGRHRFNELAITGRTLSAEEALEWGLVDALDEDPAVKNDE